MDDHREICLYFAKGFLVEGILVNHFMNYDKK